MALWVYFVTVSVALPALHGAALTAFVGRVDQVSLYLFFEASIWVSSTAIYLMDGYRARVLEGVVPLKEAILKMGLAGFLTPAVALVISPLEALDIGPVTIAFLVTSGLLVGTGAGWLYWALTRNDPL